MVTAALTPCPLSPWHFAHLWEKIASPFGDELSACWQNASCNASGIRNRARRVVRMSIKQDRVSRGLPKCSFLFPPHSALQPPPQQSGTGVALIATGLTYRCIGSKARCYRDPRRDTVCSGVVRSFTKCVALARVARQMLFHPPGGSLPIVLLITVAERTFQKHSVVLRVSVEVVLPA